MDTFEYVMVLTSIIIGLGMTHLLQGVAGLVQHPKRGGIDWIHLVWVAHMFLTAVIWWWFEFRLQSIGAWTFPLYLFVIGYAFLVFLGCALLFPADLEGYEGYGAYFLAQRGWFFGLQATMTAADVVDTWAKGRLMTFSAEYWVQAIVFFLLFIVAMFVRDRRYHAVLAVGTILYQIAAPLRFLATMG